MKVDNYYTSVAVNRTPTALDWGRNKQICYAAGHSIAILNVSKYFTSKFKKK
jgi:hypothetical protein